MQPAHQTLAEAVPAQPIRLPSEETEAAVDLKTHVRQAHSNVLKPGVIAIQERGRIDVRVNEGGAGGGVAR